MPLPERGTMLHIAWSVGDEGSVNQPIMYWCDDHIGWHCFEECELSLFRVSYQTGLEQEDCLCRHLWLLRPHA